MHRNVFHTAAADPSRRTLAWAAVLYARPPAFASHRIAAALYLPRLPAPETIDVTVVGHNPGRAPGVTVHRTHELPRRETRYLAGLPVTAPARIVLDLAATRPRSEVEYALQELLFERHLADRELRRALADHRRHPGAALLGDILELEGPAGSGHTRSHAERALLQIIRDAGLPAPSGKNQFIEGAPADVVWSEQRVIVEVDGGR